MSTHNFQSLTHFSTLEHLELLQGNATGSYWRYLQSLITSLTIVYSTVYSGTDKKNPLKLRVTGLCAGNSPVTGEFPAQMASDAENASIWWRHHQSWPVSKGVNTQAVKGPFPYALCWYRFEINWRLNDSSAETLAKVQSDWKILVINLVSPRLNEILRYDQSASQRTHDTLITSLLR